ncbi:RnfH family protein [Thermochromatium tepidum]|uniref:UPF0125 protein E6P07_09575 n=1 Tax=Thermochromatium tepidum ATCC 43061 TaxID=316276 RepID=A0A6I6E5V0_THETI|nr:RnfH family protein [Thermochromatium tepidum]QGU33202.1 RnfH family protein [Thermochromatium tepidum ATCC 43061]
MQISVVYAEPVDQIWLALEVPEGSTAREAIECSGILNQFPWIDLETQKVGVFGKIIPLDTPLRPGDRVEIYRPILCDPQSVPRREGLGEEA